MNSSRREIVDEVALLEALQEGRLAGAARTHVIRDQPLPLDKRLAELPNALSHPHRGVRPRKHAKRWG